MDTTTKTEKLQDVINRQMVKPIWLRALLEEHGPDATVITETAHLPFGTYLIDVKPVTA